MRSNYAIAIVASVAVLALVFVVFGATRMGGGSAGTAAPSTAAQSTQPSAAQSSSEQVAQEDNGASASSEEGGVSAAEAPASKPETPEPEAPQVDDRAQREEAAVQAAMEAGKTVLTGRVEIVDVAGRAEEIGMSGSAFGAQYYNPVNALLVMDYQAELQGENPDGATRASQPTVSRSCSSVNLTSHTVNDDEEALLAPWRPYDGQTVAIAFDGFGFATDTSVALYNARGYNPQIIVPLQE
ncbi:MAG: hypothetical protein IJ131_05610 [Eggerthellaceae bacterium]|nr:hypothetical protein [Eggerthellaceae bacterium]